MKQKKANIPTAVYSGLDAAKHGPSPRGRERRERARRSLAGAINGLTLPAARAHEGDGVVLLVRVNVGVDGGTGGGGRRRAGRAVLLVSDEVAAGSVVLLATVVPLLFLAPLELGAGDDAGPDAVGGCGATHPTLEAAVDPDCPGGLLVGILLMYIVREAVDLLASTIPEQVSESA